MELFPEIPVFTLPPYILILYFIPLWQVDINVFPYFNLAIFYSCILKLLHRTVTNMLHDT